MNLARQRLAQDQAATLTIVLSVDGVAEDAGGNVAVTVRRAGAIIKQGNADAGPAGDGTYTFNLSAADCSTLGELDAEWEATLDGEPQTFRTYHEVVGGHVISLVAMRRFDPLDDEVKYKLDDLATARDLATAALEDECNTAFVRRRRVASIRDVAGKYVALSPNRDAELVSGLYGVDPSVAIDAGTLVTMQPGEGGLVAIPRIVAPLVLTYEYGWKAPPARVARAVALLAAEWAQVNIGDSPLSGREVLQTTEAGTFRYVTAGEFGRGFDIPEVNAVVQRYAE